MAIPNNQKSNGRGLVATYMTNPFWFSSRPPSGEFGSDSYKLLYAWTGGLTVPIFNPIWSGHGSTDTQTVSYGHTDRVDSSKKIKFFTDEDVHDWPLGTTRNMGNIFHSCSQAGHSNQKFGIRADKSKIEGGEETLQEVSKKKENKTNGPFHVNCPGSGLDHVTSYYWGGGSKVQTAKIKNIIGLHWMEMTAGGDDKKYYAWVNKICFLYQDSNGDEVSLIPIGNDTEEGTKHIVQYNLNPNFNKFSVPVGPGCGSPNQDNSTRGGANSAHGVLRGAFLDPEQVAYVVDNELELKGMWIEVYRNTAAKKADPRMWAWGMFPWILDETTVQKFGKWYLHPFDYMISDYGFHHDNGAVEKFVEKWYDDEDLRKRNEYFKAYDEEIQKAGGIENNVFVDPSGKFSKKILVPELQAFEADPLRYTDDMSALQLRIEDANGFIASNL